MAKNINKSVFDEASKLKLEIFGESFEEWLPVFIYDQQRPKRLKKERMNLSNSNYL